ncbi:MAG: hypothetical protein [Bacteriophage sp.]|nr:MAG: hypothetical protein [Bacteriophage sp.]
MSNQSLYAMYVIGKVESNNNWSSVNFHDPITIGMMQWYGTRAYGLLNRGRSADPTGWSNFKNSANSLASQVESNSANWNLRYLTQSEGNAWIEWSKRVENHAFQQAQWEEDYHDYSGVCDRYGFPASNVKERIFFMSMYHQSPVSAFRVIGSVSSTANINLLHSAALNDQVLGNYKNRYNTVYDLLKNWDGQSAPPDFGQSGDVDSSPGGNAPTISGTSDKTAWIHVKQNTIYLHDNGKIRTFYPSSAQNYIEKFNQGTPVDNNNQTEHGSDTGSGSSSKVVEWVKARIGKYDYSQGPGRLNPDSTGYTDCSGLWWRAYMDVTGVDVGTYTGAMAQKGTLIADSNNTTIQEAISKVKSGDLLLLGKRPIFDHVEGFVSDGQAQTLSHGGPGKGPNYQNAIEEIPYFNNSWQIRRYV